MSREADAYSFRKLIDVICSRPYLYVATGTFIGAASYVEGFAAGLDAAVTGLASEWCEFNRTWLPKKLGFTPSMPWEGVFQERYPDDQMALDQLHLLFFEYLEEKSVQGKIAH